MYIVRPQVENTDSGITFAKISPSVPTQSCIDLHLSFCSGHSFSLPGVHATLGHIMTGGLHGTPTACMHATFASYLYGTIAD